MGKINYYSRYRLKTNDYSHIEGHNLVLNSGLLLLRNSGAFTNYSGILRIGSSYKDINPNQTDVISYLSGLGQESSTIINSTHVDDEYCCRVLKFMSHSNTLNGLWAEASILNFNRFVFKDYGVLPLGLSTYAVSGYNSYGESDLSAAISLNITESDSSTRIEWLPSADQTNENNTPNGYKLYKLDGLEYKLLYNCDISNSASNMYYYDRGVNILGDTHQATNTLITPPITSGIVTTDKVPSPFIKGPYDVVSLELQIYFSNKPTITEFVDWS